MKGGFVCKCTSRVEIRTSVEQPQAYVLRAQTCSADQRSLGLFAPVHVGTCLQKCVDQRKCLIACKGLVEELVAYVMQRMRLVLASFAPENQGVGARFIFGKDAAESERIAAIDCLLHVHV